MTTAPKIELRAIKHFASMSEETYCYSATLYVDGAKWGEVSNQGHGGPDNFHGIAGKGWNDIIALNERIKATMPPQHYQGMTLEQDVELICGDLISAFLSEKDFKRLVGKKVVFLKEGNPALWTAPVPKTLTLEQAIASVRRQLPTARILNEMPFAEGLALYRAT